MPQHLNLVGPKLCLKVVAAKLSLSQNLAIYSKFPGACREVAQPSIIVLELPGGGKRDRCPGYPLDMSNVALPT